MPNLQSAKLSIIYQNINIPQTKYQKSVCCHMSPHIIFTRNNIYIHFASDSDIYIHYTY